MLPLAEGLQAPRGWGPMSGVLWWIVLGLRVVINRRTGEQLRAESTELAVSIALLL